MPSIFPSASCLSATFGQASPYKTETKPKRSPYRIDESRFSSWSVSEDVGDKANKLSDAAVKEFEKASATAQKQAGAIELYSGKYYAVRHTDDALMWTSTDTNRSAPSAVREIWGVHGGRPSPPTDDVFYAYSSKHCLCLGA